MARKSVIVPVLIMFTLLFLRSQNKKHLMFYIVLFALLITVSFSIPIIRERYVEMFSAFFGNSDSLGSTSYRLKIYECGINLITEKPWFGYGIGDTKQALLQCYNENQEIFKGRYFNSHNQFISIWLASGVTGVLSLLSMLVYNLKILFHNKLIIESFIVVLFVITLFFENILERQSGVMLFSFFINFFSFIVANKKQVS